MKSLTYLLILICLNHSNILLGNLNSNINPLEEPFNITAAVYAPSCPEVSQGYTSDGSFEIIIEDDMSCSNTTYDIIVSSAPNSSPLGNTPPLPIPNEYSNIGANDSPYLFTLAGAGDYVIEVYEVGFCNPVINPQVRIVNVPDAIDTEEPIWQIFDEIGNIIADNNPFTIPGTTANFGNITIPAGSCSYQQQLYAYGLDICNGIITDPNAISLVSNNTIPSTVTSPTQISIVPDNFGIYLLDVTWTLSTTTLVTQMDDAGGNSSNLTLIRTLLREVYPSISINNLDDIVIPVCNGISEVSFNVTINNLCEENNGPIVNVDGGSALTGTQVNTAEWEYTISVNAAMDGQVIQARFTDYSGEFTSAQTTLNIDQAIQDFSPIIDIPDETDFNVASCNATTSATLGFQVTDDCTAIDPDFFIFNDAGAGFSSNPIVTQDDAFSAYIKFAGDIGPGSYNMSVSYNGEVNSNFIVNVSQAPPQAPDIIMPNNLNLVIPTCESELETTFSILIQDECDEPINGNNASFWFNCGGSNIPLTPVSQNGGQFEFVETISPDMDGCLLIGSYSDNDGLSTTVDGLMTVNLQQDYLEPVIFYPFNNLEFELDPCDDDGFILETFEVSAIDNCDGELMPSIDVPSGIQLIPTEDGRKYMVLAYPGVYVVGINATDAAGNTSSENFQIVVTQDPPQQTNLGCNDNINVMLVNNNQAVISYDMVLDGNFGCLTGGDFEIVVQDSDTSNGEIVDGIGDFIYNVFLASGNLLTSFSGPFAPENWSYLIPHEGSVQFTNSNQNVSITSSDGAFCPACDALMAIGMPSDGVIAFDYTFDNLDPNGAFLDAFIALIDISGNQSILVDNNGQTSGGGSINQAVNEGEVLIVSLLSHPGLPGPATGELSSFSFDGDTQSNPGDFTTCWGYVHTYDGTPPEITCSNQTLVFSTSPFDCTANFNIPTPEITSSCASSVTLTPSILTTEGLVIQEYASIEVNLTNPPVSVGSASGIPTGCFYFRYHIVDACANETIQDCFFFVEDQVEPVAICDDDLNISIGGAGIARIYPEDIDEGSWDNCGPTRMEVRRLYLHDPMTCAPTTAFYSDWGDYIDFNCCDVNELANMQLRVWDDRNGDGIPGNTITRLNCDGTTELITDNNNVCWLEVLVEDMILPFCIPPQNVVTDCTDIPYDFDPFDTVQLQDLFGEAEATDNCPDATWEELTPIVTLHDCGFGTIIRRFRAIDAWGNVSSNSCLQIVTIREVHNYEICFPKDASANCGNPSLDTIVTNEIACDLLAVSVDDETSSPSDDECYNISRIYRVINWCEYDGESDPIIVDRDVDCDNNPGDEAICVLVRPIPNTQGQTITYYDRDQDETNLTPAQFTKSPVCDGLTNPTGYWIDSDMNTDLASRGYWQYTQVIKVYDSDSPVITPGAFDPFCSLDNVNCDGPVDIPFAVSESCTPDDITINVFLDAFDDDIVDFQVTIDNLGNISGDNGIFSINGSYPNYNITSTGLPIGSHVFNVNIEDGCDNIGIIQIPFNVVDCKAPTPACINGLAIELMPTEPGTDADGDGDIDSGAMAVWAIDFIASPIPDCSEPIIYSINRASEQPGINQSGIILTCDDPENLTIEIYAWDAAGNSDFCETYILVQDNMFGVCDVPTEASISGQVLQGNGTAVPNVEITLSGGSNLVTQTNDLGNYDFTPIPVPEDYTITPYSDEAPEMCLTVTDAAMIISHILGTTTLSTINQILAADVDHSQSVTPLDFFGLRDMVLLKDLSFPNNTSWRFVDASYNFPNPSNPWAETFPEAINIANLSDVAINQDFIAFKIGDLNYCQEKSSQEIIDLTMESITTSSGESIEVNVLVENAADVLGLQFSLEWDPALLNFTGHGNYNVSIGSSSFYALPSNAGLTFAANGIWSFATGDTLFTLYFDVADAGPTNTNINFSTSPIDMEATDTNLQPFSIGTTSGVITIEEVTPILDTLRTFIEDQMATVGETICMPIKTEKFSDVVGMGFTMRYDPNTLEFNTITNLNSNLPGFSISAHFGTPNNGLSPGFISVLYVDDGFTPISISDESTLFELCFTAIGCSQVCPAIQFTNDITPIEFVNDNSNVIPFRSSPAVICVEDNDAATNTLSGSLCPDEFLIVNGTLYNQTNPNGTEILTAANGCDSTVMIDLTFLSDANTNLNPTLCPNEILLVNGTLYNQSNPVGTEILIANNGCDSVVQVNLNFHQINTVPQTINLCPGESEVIGGVTYSEDNLSGLSVIPDGDLETGCDLLLEVSVNIYQNNQDTLHFDRCEGDIVTIDGTIYDENTPSGIQMAGQTIHGCDSTLYVFVSFYPEIMTEISPTFCPGESLTINGTIYDENNPMGTEILTTSSGCDSIIDIDLSYYAIITTELTPTLCPGEFLMVNGTIYNENQPSGSEVLTANNGCDSIITVSLNFFLPVETEIVENLCPGIGIEVNGNLYNEDNPTGTEMLLAENGCDSVITIDLSYYQTFETSVEATICEGQVYEFDGALLNESGTYQGVFQDVNGCDSTVHIMLDVSEVLSSSFNAAICEGEVFVWNDQTYDVAGVYEQAFTTSEGCDSMVTLQLDEFPRPDILGSPSQSYAICQGSPFPLLSLSASQNATIDWYASAEGNDLLVQGSTIFTPTTPGDFYAEARDTTTGCTSSFRIPFEFTSIPPIVESFSTFSCQISNVGIDSMILTASNGCDSLVIINTLYDPIEPTLIEEITCVWEKVGVDTIIQTNEEGCDSLVLREYLFDPSFIIQGPDTITCTASQVGTDTTILTTPDNCNILILRDWETAVAAMTLLDTFICTGDTFPFNNELLTEPGIYYDTLHSTEGCDRIFMLTLDEIEPEAFKIYDDNYTIVQGRTRASLQLIDNDELPNQSWTISLDKEPTQGIATLSPEGQLDYTLETPSFLGIDSFTYQLCNPYCPDTCLLANIYIAVLRDCLEELKANLPTGFTPDGDDLNELFDPIAMVANFGCLQNPDNARLTIFNRWGEIVYEPDAYQAWDGRYINGQLVPQGVYYYILRFELEEEVVLRKEVHVLR